ncbi:MAG: hypothetical protein FWE40_02295, partial [Oscillospiraceae bacterium]|nr:hypothetical protein [Oscillospiraceae bacterium]
SDRFHGMVSLYTIHKAKGLEFPIVVLLNCDANLLRNRSSPKIIFENDDSVQLAFDPNWLPHTDRDYYKLAQQRTLHALEEELRVLHSRKRKDKALGGFGVSWAKWVNGALQH